MVRILVGTLLEIGNKKRPVDDIPRVLAAKDRQEVRTTAPASGLYLQHVFYENVPKKYRLDLKKIDFWTKRRKLVYVCLSNDRPRKLIVCQTEENGGI